MNTTLPHMIYGTAWKGEHTYRYVLEAIEAGFTAFDTANQPKHYSEQLVGKALIAAQQQSAVTREQLFLQTKFTPPNGHDHRIPYDLTLPLEQQILMSFNQSLEHLQTHYLDAYLLHAPYHYLGLGEEDSVAWETLERLYTAGHTRLIGISNVNLDQLISLVKQAKIKPMIVQNRCFARQGWDQAVREFCLQNEIIYQGFSLLTANPNIVNSPTVVEIAARLHKTPAQIIFAFSRQIGIVPLTGTTNPLHLQQDLQAIDLIISEEYVNLIKNMSEI